MTRTSWRSWLSVPALSLESLPRATDAQVARPIPFRTDDSLGGLALSVGLGLVIALGAGLGALHLLRRYLARSQGAPGRRLRVIETVRLGPKSALFLVEIDGRSLLVGQQGESLAVLTGPQRAGDPPRRGEHAA